MLSYDDTKILETLRKAHQVIREVASGERKVGSNCKFGMRAYLDYLSRLLACDGYQEDKNETKPSHLTALLIKVFRDFCQSHLSLRCGIHQTYHFDFSLLEASARPGHPAFAPPSSL